MSQNLVKKSYNFLSLNPENRILSFLSLLNFQGTQIGLGWALFKVVTTAQNMMSLQKRLYVGDQKDIVFVSGTSR